VCLLSDFFDYLWSAFDIYGDGDFLSTVLSTLGSCDLFILSVESFRAE